MTTPINTGPITANRGTSLNHGQALAQGQLGSFILGESELGSEGLSIEVARLTIPKINATDPIRR